MAGMSTWATSLAVAVRHVFCGFCFFSPPGHVALWDSKTPHRPTHEMVSYCLETSPSQLSAQDRSPSLTLLSLLLSFIFCPTSFWREWAAFLGAWCLPPAFRRGFLEVAQHSNDLLMNLLGRKWSPILFLRHLGTPHDDYFYLHSKNLLLVSVLFLSFVLWSLLPFLLFEGYYSTYHIFMIIR